MNQTVNWQISSFVYSFSICLLWLYYSITRKRWQGTDSRSYGLVRQAPLLSLLPHYFACGKVEMVTLAVQIVCL